MGGEELMLGAAEQRRTHACAIEEKDNRNFHAKFVAGKSRPFYGQEMRIKRKSRSHILCALCCVAGFGRHQFLHLPIKLTIVCLGDILLMKVVSPLVELWILLCTCRPVGCGRAISRSGMVT